MNDAVVSFDEEILSVLKLCLEYNSDTGKLFWLNRPRSHFKTDASFQCWNKRFAGKEAGTYHSPNGNPRSINLIANFLGRRICFKVHRIIYSLMVRPLSLDEEIDHRDGNPFNNKLENLRISDNFGNNRNQPKKRRNGVYSIYPKGVSKHGRVYRARIMYNRKTHWLGSFETPEEAGKVYVEASKALFGEFARV